MSTSVRLCILTILALGLAHVPAQAASGYQLRIEGIDLSRLPQATVFFTHLDSAGELVAVNRSGRYQTLVDGIGHAGGRLRHTKEDALDVIFLINASSPDNEAWEQVVNGMIRILDLMPVHSRAGFISWGDLPGIRIDPTFPKIVAERLRGLIPFSKASAMRTDTALKWAVSQTAKSSPSKRGVVIYLAASAGPKVHEYRELASLIKYCLIPPSLLCN